MSSTSGFPYSIAMKARLVWRGLSRCSCSKAAQPSKDSVAVAPLLFREPSSPLDEVVQQPDEVAVRQRPHHGPGLQVDAPVFPRRGLNRAEPQNQILGLLSWGRRWDVGDG